MSVNSGLCRLVNQSLHNQYNVGGAEMVIIGSQSLPARSGPFIHWMIIERIPCHPIIVWIPIYFLKMRQGHYQISNYAILLLYFAFSIKQLKMLQESIITNCNNLHSILPNSQSLISSIYEVMILFIIPMMKCSSFLTKMSYLPQLLQHFSFIGIKMMII